MGDPQTAYSPTMPQGHSKWRDVGLVSSRSYSQAYHFHDRPLTKEEKRFHEKCTRPAASRTLTAPAALPAQEYQDKNDDDNVPLSVLRNGKLRDRLQRQQSCYSLNQPPAPPTTQSFSQQNAHMLASSNKHGQPSISSVILGEPYSAFSHVSFTRREAFAPAEAGRPVAARYRACHNQSIQRSLSTSGVSSTMRGPGNRHPAVGEYGHRLRENTGYPLVSNSGLAYREADHASPALACRLKTKGSLASLDYGRIGSCGVANKNSSVASSSSIESDRSSKNGQQGSSSEDSSPGQEDICVHLGGAHRVGPECNDSHQLRTRRTSLALEVQERLDRASRICSGLLSVHEHLAPNFRMQIQACIAERAAIQEWATLFATHGSPQPHLATQRIPEEDQVGTTEHLRRMVRVLEIKVDHVRATVVRNSALESLAAIERGSEGRRSGERSSSAAKLRRGEEVQPTIAEETEPESETESMLKGLGTKRRVCTNF
ncbi:hypothetical protein B0A50_07641 [Salinomyces thailandicus]|uniref:Uncharacterized protein n=1 Tax=Salinomyces thailandicus TaxID=706561 RepID=A0A4U0TLM8_9PEZI|nr:hypothetical protein B0A50_07641 [Salinomyces thailandica]